MAMDADLGRDVLRDVSRSFYLSLRFLPSGFREPMALGYLLARLSDTIADAGTLPMEERLRTEVPGRRGTGLAKDLVDKTRDAGLSEAEHRLVEHTADVLAAAAAL